MGKALNNLPIYLPTLRCLCLHSRMNWFNRLLKSESSFKCVSRHRANMRWNRLCNNLWGPKWFSARSRFYLSQYLELIHPLLITDNINSSQTQNDRGSQILFSSQRLGRILPHIIQCLTWARPRPCLTVDGRPPTECRLPPKLHPVSAAWPLSAPLHTQKPLLAISHSQLNFKPPHVLQCALSLTLSRSLAACC